jgi:hypothetical protein
MGAVARNGPLKTRLQSVIYRLIRWHTCPWCSSRVLCDGSSRPLPVTEGNKIAATKRPFAGCRKLTLTARGVQLKGRFNSVAILIAATGYLALAAHHYLTAPTSISDFTRHDFFYIFGVLLAFASIYRAASWLRDTHKTR